MVKQQFFDNFTLKQFVGNLPKNCLSVFDHFVELALKGLRFFQIFWQQEV